MVVDSYIQLMILSISHICICFCWTLFSYFSLVTWSVPCRPLQYNCPRSSVKVHDNMYITMTPDEHYVVWNNRHSDCMYNSLFRCRLATKNKSKFCITGIFVRRKHRRPSQGTTNAESVSMKWRHHVITLSLPDMCTALSHKCHYSEPMPPWG